MGTIRNHPVARDRNFNFNVNKNQRSNTMSPSATTIKLRMPARVRRNLVSRLIFSATRHAASTATPATSKMTLESRAARVVSKAARSFTDVCIAKYSIVPHPAVLRAHEELTLASLDRELETDRSSVLSRADSLLNASLANQEE